MRQAQAAHLDEPPPRAPVVRLLPSFDTYLLGYRGRDFAVGPLHAKRINAGGGIVHPTVLVDGRARGTWRTQRRRDTLEVTLEPFDPLSPESKPGLEAEVADIGRFLDLKSTLRIGLLRR